MGDNTTEQIYPLTNDSVEAKRLNHQHVLFRTYCSGNLIHTSIPKDSLETIADIATGTGIWLDDVSKTLDKIPTKSGNERSYDGFDISTAMFPSNPQKKISFHIQDMFQPFPAEFHGKYDLVHLRFVVAATNEHTYKIVVNNIISLLKPGGYIQWDDAHWPGDFLNPNAPANTKETEQAIAEMKSTDETSMNFFRLNNISCRLPDLVEGSLKEVGLEAVTKHEYPVPDTEERIAASREFRYEITAAMAPLLLRTGQAKTAEEAEAIVEKDLNIFRRYFEEGWYSTMPMMTVVGRKGEMVRGNGVGALEESFTVPTGV